MKHLYRQTNSIIGRLLLFFTVIVLFTQCTPPRIAMQPGKRVEQLGVCLVFAPQVPLEFQEEFENTLELYMQRYNQERHAFQLTSCQDTSSLSIFIDDVQYTNSSQRTTGFLVSAVGLIGVPVAMVASGLPFYAFFYYFPKNETLATLELSRDLGHQQFGRMARTYTSGGMFGSDEKQRLRHSQKFTEHLNLLFKELEKSYQKTSRR
ncbi:hypothetical protein [Pontibacter roseus]|uniref:hypothetical protein n=1 Tax=Pontibacter roseus TaxID=336989 RepID=UPI000362C464|nr:hypothetical protein [Pontibacter roseus]